MARPRKNPLTVKKTCLTCGIEFEISYRKKHQQYCSKKCVYTNGDILSTAKETRKKTNISNYGVEHPMKIEEVKETLKRVMIEKYGVSSYTKLPECREKIKKTCLLKYGVENYHNAEKTKKTNLQRYGVENYRDSKEFSEKYKKTCLEKYGVDHSSKSSEFKNSHKQSMFEKFISNERFVNFTPKFTMDEYCGVTEKFNKKYSFECIRCKRIESSDISDGKPPKCSKCDKKSISYFQEEIVDFIKEILPTENIIVNDRSILYPREVDIYIPSLKFGIECNGLYWHSEVLGKKNKYYHLNKTKACILKEVILIHIFEDMWYYKKDIVKSILRNILNRTANHIYARKCSVKEIDKDTCKNFLKNNHIQGNDRSSTKLGLYYNNDLVSVMTFCKSRFDKKLQWELSRFCNKLNTTIVGGASKLFSNFIKNYNPESIVSYCDRRLFGGTVYLNMGFSFVQNTSPGYHYIIDNYKTTQNRMNWQKQKLKGRLPNFNPDISEWENMKNHGFDRVWDCGSSKWVFLNKRFIHHS